jgi:PPM family protein phosphatase
VTTQLCNSNAGSGELMITVRAVTHPGQVRGSNEDCVLFVKPEPGLYTSRGALAVVADGMGGANAGEVASRLACEVIAQTYFSEDRGPEVALLSALRAANEEIFAYSQTCPEFAGMGTTCVAAVFIGRTAWFVSVGDSRLYLLRDGRIYQLSEDDSLVAQMVRDGVLGPEMARSHDQRNVLLRALGTKPELNIASPPVSIECRAGDGFLFCTDGLHDLVSEPELLHVATNWEPGAVAEQLLTEANARGGHDNVSVIFVTLNEPSLPLSSLLRETRQVVVG